MSSLADRIAASSRRPTATVRLGGARWRDVLSLSRNQQYGSGISGGEVLGRNPPVTIVEGETAISWTWGYDGYEVAGFAGVVSRIHQRSYPNQWSLQVADPLWLADIRRGDIATSPLNSIAASAAITQILSAAGLSRLSIGALAASGSAWAGDEWVLGTLTPVAFANTTALAAATQIAQTLGYWLYCDAGGTARLALLERRPSDSPARTLRWGEDFLLGHTPERERDASQVKNRVVVRGANTGVQGAQIWDEFYNGGADRSAEITYSLIEYVNVSQAGNASCTAAAERQHRLLSRQPNVIRVPRLKADPRLAVGQTVAIEAALLGYRSAKPFFIYSLQSKLDLRAGDFAQSLVLDGGAGDGGYTTLPPPEAGFSWRLVRETLNGVGVVEVFLDGSGSVSFGGEIVSWAWSSATAVASGYSATASGVRAMFVYPAATVSAAITLTVMDTSSKTGSITQTIVLAGDATSPLRQRVISLALGSAWAVTPDGGTTWHVEAGTARTLVPEAGGATLLASDGAQLRQSADRLASASTLAATRGGTITALSQTQGLPLRVWAAVGTALSRSIDGGATWASWGTLPASVSAILEDPAVLNSVFVLAGADMLHATTDTPGTGWATLYAGPSGATARHLVRGESGATTWVSYTGTFIGSPLQRVEGPISATFPVGTSPAVAEIRALALSLDERTVYAWDGQGRGWAVASATGIATAITATLAAGETAQHALADPDDPIVYLATFGASAGTTYKYFPLADVLGAFYVPDAAGQQAHRIGLGGPPASALEVLILTDGATPGGVWHQVNGAWVLKYSGLPSGWRWLHVAVSPFSPSTTWLIQGYKVSAGVTRSGGFIRSDGHPVLWITTDAGATWAGIPMADDGTPGPAYAPENSNNRQAIGFTSTGQIFVFGNHGSGTSTTVALWRGTAAGLSRTLLTTQGGSRGGHNAIAGQDGDLIVAYRNGSDLLGFIPAGASTWTAIGTDRLAAGLARVGLTRQALTQASGGTRTYADYRASAAATTSDAGEYVAVRGGRAYLAGGRTGVYGVAEAAIVAAAGVTTLRIESDPAQTAVAAIVGNATAVTLHFLAPDATEWATMPGPSGGSLRSQTLGVITR
jgi:hypothetical protein